MNDGVEIFQQMGLSAVFYLGVVVLFRIAGKRFAGQTTTFDLIVLISLAVAIQKVTLKDGDQNALIFIVTVFCLHMGIASLCRRSRALRWFLRGAPRKLVEEGEVLYSNLRLEGLSVDELRAGLRKVGIEDIAKAKVAYLEETGQISGAQKSPS